MALSKSSKILVSDINTALSNKQDKLSYTPVKSVNGTTADSSGNVAISVSAPVTSVNGKTGAVTISSVGAATTVPTVYTNSRLNPSFNLPSGGTWAYFAYCGSSTSDTAQAGNAAGGSQVQMNANGTTRIIAIRTA